MTTCLKIATRALRALGVLGANQEAAGSDGQDALQHLQDTINDLPGLLKGDWVETRLSSASTYAGSDGERINTMGFAATITFPTTYVDEDGCTAALLDLSRLHILGGDQAGLWVYSASTGAWARADDLELTSEHPFGPEDDAGLAALVAADLIPEYGDQATLSPVMVERAARQMRSFRARFRRTTHTPVDEALLAMSDTGHYSTRGPNV